MQAPIHERQAAKASTRGEVKEEYRRAMRNRGREWMYQHRAKIFCRRKDYSGLVSEVHHTIYLSCVHLTICLCDNVCDARRKSAGQSLPGGMSIRCMVFKTTPSLHLWVGPAQGENKYMYCYSGFLETNDIFLCQTKSRPVSDRLPRVGCDRPLVVNWPLVINWLLVIW